MIIGLSAKKQSGKDTVCKIIQYLVTCDKYQNKTDTNWTVEQFKEGILDSHLGMSGWQKKMFAEKLKQIVCLLLGCTMEQLEDNEFKEKELGEEWDKWEVIRVNMVIPFTYEYFSNKEEAEKRVYELGIFGRIGKIRLTPRLMLQLLGTECGRNIIHPNIWINALMVDYKPSPYLYEQKIKGFSTDIHDKIKSGEDYPNWIVTDVRFPNEVKAIEDRGGIVVRIIRKDNPNNIDSHYSEISLDLHKFEYVIDNSGTIEELIDQVAKLLCKLKITVW